MADKRVLTGMRTTGALHLGHYVGALKQWKEVQDSNQYECFFLLADVQALTTHAHKPELLSQSVKDVVLDWLAIGLDPTLANVHFVLQSQVKERYELSILLSMIAGYNEVMRNPTLKDELKNQKDVTIGFMTYPVDQVADIYMVSPYPPEKGQELLVPVGEDQVPHLEYARVLARRFNKMYGPVFVPCDALVGEIGRLVGIDGQAKMSKSLGNSIDLSDDKETVTAKVKSMFTDPKRIRPDIPGETENNPVFIYHRAFNPNKEEVADLTERYQKGKVGDVEVKEKLAKALNNFLDPVRERRVQAQKSADIGEIVRSGTEVARKACIPVVEAVREYMHLKYPK
ncbi:tryptophan--tRNA ligase [Candidatus Woesebacteria bacterium RBG_16_36_11]|uniref:Tryptophan--tRNA ligase n=3 Tax=Candidatus Woeseibacteriota TaxID=1752722 RepID=A0A1F7X762_9BACT|nr:MAG: tryptophan--tRNA ligase [Candidatus Woesebacteria bacterium RBG_13_36_22]OGM10906.1 MAG: tryptophan--tRNA ligase [Candidatus Woesebacteria bacterium RBG_16_36_11]OGM16876.1 MAG: tryptophan--tRNA ligase [Candidatus Woesebacteria bacterium RBG_19FT_COMBO_37_29]